MYFKHCGHNCASYAQIKSFLVDCLGVEPGDAASYASQTIGLNENAKIADGLYEIKQPPALDGIPRVLMDGIKKDEQLSLIKSDSVYTIHSDCFDESGKAVTYKAYVKVVLRKLAKSGVVFSAEEIRQLMDVNWCKQNMNIPRAMLRNAMGVKMEKGKGYWLEKFMFGQDSFYVCDYWHSKNKDAFDKLVVRKAREFGVDFTPYEILNMQ